MALAPSYHHTGDRVWVPAIFLDKDTAAIRVGDGTLATGYLTMEEAEREMK